MGGWGCHSPIGWERSSYLPPHERQTVNRAELQAVITTLEHFSPMEIKLATATDSSYVYSGVQGSALKWRANSWVTAQGPVTNVDMWIRLMILIDQSKGHLAWIKVPSHTDLQGNERADFLAEEGRKMSPLYKRTQNPTPPPSHTSDDPPIHVRISPDDFVHTTVEVQSMCTANVGTPMILRSQDGQNELAIGIDPVCRLFECDPDVPPPPLLYKLRPCPSYSRRRDRNNLVRNLIAYEM